MKFIYLLGLFVLMQTALFSAPALAIDPVPNEYILSYDGSVPYDVLKTEIEKAGFQILNHMDLIQVIVVRGAANLKMKALKTIPGIASVTPHGRVFMAGDDEDDACEESLDKD